MHSIIMSLFGIKSALFAKKDTTKSTEMVTPTEKGCHGSNAAAESRGE